MGSQLSDTLLEVTDMQTLHKHILAVVHTHTQYNSVVNPQTIVNALNYTITHKCTDGQTVKIQRVIHVNVIISLEQVCAGKLTLKIKTDARAG